MIIDDKDYTQEEIQQVFDLCRELLRANEDLNAKMIAFDAKLKNEEKKVAKLKLEMMQLAGIMLNDKKFKA